MSYFVYIIQSILDGAYYVGSTGDLRLRLDRHNEGWTRSTKRKRPWRIVHVEEFETKSEALRRERAIKRRKSRKYIEQLIHAGGRPEMIGTGSPVGPAKNGPFVRKVFLIVAYYVYIIQSETSGRYYVGSSGDPHLRVERHNGSIDNMHLTIGYFWDVLSASGLHYRRHRRL